MRRAARQDVNHAELADEFRRLGASVIDLSQLGGGIPDVCIGVGKQVALVEFKRDAKAKFTPDQLDFMTTWNGRPVFRAETVDHVRYIVHHLRGHSA
jgi:hypothetical protein